MIMYCDRCNIDFSEGLRYCKWCGQTLVERRRVTSELKACPACSVTVQPSWVFCKGCGARLADAHLTDAAREPATEIIPEKEPPQTGASEMGGTAFIAKCPACGEKVDTGSVYCKGCGIALYDHQTPFGSSALLCSACHSYSPLGSTACRVCGALLIETASSIAEDANETLAISRVESSTLPDLAEHLPGPDPEERLSETAERASHFGDDEIESGAHTLTLAQAEPKRADNKSSTPAAPRTKGGDTSMLPGVAGSKFEQPLPTSALQMERTTGPVDSEESENAEPSAASSEPHQTSPVTRIDTASYASVEEETAGQSTVQFISEAGMNPPQKDPGTIALSSGVTPPSAFKGDDQTSAFQLGEESEQIRTEQFAAIPPPVETRPPSSASVETPHPTPPAPNDSRALDNVMRPTEEFIRPVDEPVQRAERNLAERNLAAAQNESQVAVAEPVAAKKKSGAPVLAAVAVLIVLALAVVAIWWFATGRKPAEQTQPPVVATETPTEQAQPAPQPAQPPAPIAPEGMVVVPAGAYTIGRDDESELESPRHTVNLPAFFIDRTEVTNADYSKFIDATSHKPPANWKGRTYPANRANYPVTGVTWQDAADYARFAGKRLPTEAEWEAAARGIDGRRYPWGNDWRASFANIDVKSVKDYKADEYPDEIRPAGQYPDGASAAGALDLIGNVWEFTADKFALYPGNPQSINEIRVGPDRRPLKLERGKTYRIIRGGAFDGDKQHDASYRGLIDASLPYPKTGFRCAKDAN